MDTPWGQAQDVERVEPGVFWVSTASHGGLMVALEIAVEKLSVKAFDVAYPGSWGLYLCFEEDCSYAVAFFEHPEWKQFLDSRMGVKWKAVEAIRETLRPFVTTWFPEYFGLPRREPYIQRQGK